MIWSGSPAVGRCRLVWWSGRRSFCELPGARTINRSPKSWDCAGKRWVPWREHFAAGGVHNLEDQPRAGLPRRILEPAIAEGGPPQYAKHASSGYALEHAHPGSGDRRERLDGGPDLAGARPQTTSGQEFYTE
jgi:hypothetical protein